MHRLARTLIATAAVSLLAFPAHAQTGSQDQQKKNPPSKSGQQQPQMTPEQKAEMEAYMKAATPGPQHQGLASAAGNYSMKVKSWHDPAGPAMEDTGTAKRSMELGGRVLVEEVQSTMMGQPFTGHGMTGYDNVTGKYWSTWNDTMGTGVMLSEGTCDASGKNCTFKGSWVDPIKKTPITARMTSKWTSPTTEIFEMFAPGPDGKEMKMMEITYTKQ
jgi:hypothetical protein